METGSRSETITKQKLIKRQRGMLALATTILIVLAVAHALVARLSIYQVAINLVGGMATTWSLTFLIFNIVFRLSDQVEKRDQQLSARERELAALQVISHQISTTVDLQAILDTISQKAMDITPSVAGYVVLCQDGKPISIAAAKGRAATRTDLLGEFQDSALFHSLDSNESLLIDHTRSAAEPVPMSGMTLSALSTPISYEQAVVGAIILHSATPRAYRKDHLLFVESLAEQASIAYGNAQRYQDQIRLNDALRRWVEQQQSLFEASCSLRMDKPLNVILEDIAYAIQESVGFGIVLISAVEGSPRYLRRMAGVGIPLDVLQQLVARHQPLAPVLALFQERFRLSQSYFIPHHDKGLWQELDVLTLLPGQKDVEADRWHAEDILFTPLRSSEGKLLGVISVDDPTDGYVPNQTTVEVLETFATQASLAIENARLYEALQRRIVELNALNDIGQALGSSLEERDLLEALYRRTSEILPVSRFAIALYDETKDELEDSIAIVDGQRIRAAMAPRDNERVRRIIESREPLLVSAQASEDSGDKHVARSGDRWLGVPMVTADKVIGVIIAEGGTETPVYNGEHTSLLSTIASQAATALQNARLYDQIRRFSQVLEQRVRERTEELARINTELMAEKERAEALYRITRELGASLDLRRVLSRALTLVTQAVGTRHGVIAMLDRETGELHYRTLMGRAQALTEAEASIPLPQDRGHRELGDAE